MVKIAPSILTAEFNKLDEEIKSVVDAGADIIHVDVMDGRFVSNMTHGEEMLKVAKKNSDLPVDVHLMVTDPMKWISDNIVYKPSIVSFHIEAVDDETARKIISFLHANKIGASIAIKPNTAIEAIIPYLDVLDMILVMTVEPGYGGQKMIEECLKKVKKIRKLNKKIDIEVDGGVNLENIKKVKKAGANVIVAGTVIFNSNNRKEVIHRLAEA